MEPQPIGGDQAEVPHSGPPRAANDLQPTASSLQPSKPASYLQPPTSSLQPRNALHYVEQDRVFRYLGDGRVVAEHMPNAPGGRRGQAKRLELRGRPIAMGMIGRLMAVIYEDGDAQRLRYGGDDYLIVTEDGSAPLPVGPTIGRLITVSERRPKDGVPQARFLVLIGDRLWHGAFEDVRVPLGNLQAPERSAPFAVVEALDAARATALVPEQRWRELFSADLAIDRVTPDGTVVSPPAWLSALTVSPYLRVQCLRYPNGLTKIVSTFRGEDIPSVERTTLPDGARFMGCGRVQGKGGVLLWCDADQRTVHGVLHGEDTVLLETPWPIRDWSVDPGGWHLVVVGEGDHLAAASIQTRRPLFVEGD